MLPLVLQSQSEQGLPVSSSMLVNRSRKAWQGVCVPDCWMTGNLLSWQTWSLQTDLGTSVLNCPMHPRAGLGLCSVQATSRAWVWSEELQMCPTLFHPYMLLTASSPTGSQGEGSIEVQLGSSRATPPCTHCQGHSPSLLEQQGVTAGMWMVLAM